MRSCRAWIPLGLAMVVAAGCGTRVHDEGAKSALTPSAAVTPAGGAAAPESTAPGPSGSESAPGAAQSTVGATTPSGARTGTGSTAGGSSGAGGSSAGKVPSTAGSASGAGSGTAAEPRPSGGSTARSGTTPGAGGSTPAPPVVGGPKATIVVGNVGTYSGPVGSSLADLPQGVQVWSRWINDRGGVNGHPIKFVVADDGADPARHRALVQQMVETQGAIALVGNGEVVTGASSVEYLSAKGIPVIGNEGGSDWFYSSPTYFTTVSTGQTYWKAVASSVAAVAKAKGKKKWGSITCTEATTCGDADRIWTSDGEMKGQGLQPVYNARSSLAQPDFTAECLNARNAGAEILTMVMDAATVQRVAASCVRQGYKPIFTEVAASSKTEHAADPNLSGGLIATLGLFLWTDGSTPATAEFQAAVKQYLGKAPGAGHAAGWAAARVFEKAAAAIGEPATAAAVLDGLYSFNGETVGGLVMPLTFTRGQNALRQICWATNYAEGGKWTAFDGGRISCR
jgi:branched-chain amino acid transport system substrate-binding protein